MSSTMIKAEPGNYVLSLKELDNGQMVLSKHPKTPKPQNPAHLEIGIFGKVKNVFCF
jgi:hypothetical protein